LGIETLSLFEIRAGLLELALLQRKQAGLEQRRRLRNRKKEPEEEQLPM
jgi:hypothetical protein